MRCRLPFVSFMKDALSTNAMSRRRPSGRTIALDCVLLLALGLAAQSAAFTSKMGRAIVCIDSYQYIATAEALLDPELTPHFEMRKPGYPLFLAGVKLLTGRLGWTAVVANHFLLAMLPLAAYGFGVHLRSRGLGWFAAILLLARLQTAFSMRTADFGNWMMSEALFTFLLSFALLLFFAGLRRDRFVRWMVPAGCLMGSAWLTRGTVTAIIPVAFLAILWIHRSGLRRMCAMSVAFMLPIAVFVVIECSLNLTCGGQFRPSHGTGGSCMWAYRMQAFQGAEVPNSDDGRFLLKLLPERPPSDAYVAWAPFNHMAATEPSIRALLLGGKVIVIDGFDPTRIADERRSGSR